MRYVLGGNENPLTLTSHDWLMPDEKQAAWHQKHIQRGDLINGPWAVNVKQKGSYEITLHRWPSYLNKPMDITAARITIGSVDLSHPVEKSATGTSFQVSLDAGPSMLQTWLTRPDGKQHGAYFAQVRLITE